MGRGGKNPVVFSLANEIEYWTPTSNQKKKTLPTFRVVLCLDVPEL